MRSRVLLAGALLLGACQADGPADATSDLATMLAGAEPGAVIELPGGTHAGPLTITRPVTIIGNGGTVSSASPDEPAISIVDTAEVTIRDLTVEGGYSGIEVRRATGVELDEITVTGSAWHGIFVHDGQVAINECHISGLTAEFPQGVEIINSDGRPPSLVQGCRIEGPVVEGVVSHVSRVTFRDNEVTGSTLRGIAVTEMSAGLIEGNTVTDATGSAYFCGDMSRCSVVDNVALRVASENVGFKSTNGHALVVHFYSQAFIDDLRVAELEGEGIIVMLDSEVVPVPVYP